MNRPNVQNYVSKDGCFKKDRIYCQYKRASGHKYIDLFILNVGVIQNTF